MPKNEFYFFNFTFHFAFDNGGIQLPYIFLYLRNETIIKKHEELLKQWFTKVLRSRFLILETRAFPGLSTGQKYISGQLGFKYFSSDHSIPEMSPLAHFQLHIATSATVWIQPSQGPSSAHLPCSLMTPRWPWTGWGRERQQRAKWQWASPSHLPPLGVSRWDFLTLPDDLSTQGEQLKDKPGTDKG